MAYSYVTSTGDGSTTDYSIPFDYIAKADVTVLVNGVSVPFSWVNDSLIRCTTAPAGATTVKRQRTTSKATLSVSYQDASTLRAADLNLQDKQLLFISQETSDANSDAVVAAYSLDYTKLIPGTLNSYLVTATGRTTARALGTFFSDLSFNVKDFGALGDATTDDTAAIQSAVTAAGVIGGEVFYPLGNYKVSDEILVTRNGVSMRGEANTEALSIGSRIVQTSTSKSIIRVSTSVQSISGFEINNIGLYGAGNGGSAGSGLHFDSTTAGRNILGFTVRNVHVKNCKQHGILLDSSTATSFIFDGVIDKVRTVNNFGCGLKATGSVIQVLVNKIYSEINGASQIHLSGVDQTTCPQGWQFNSYVVGLSPAVAGTAAVYLENVSDLSAFNVWHESSSNAEMILKSCKGIIVKGGRISQGGTCDGVVIGFSGAFPTANIEIDVPGWSNTSSKKRVDISQFGGGSFLQSIRLGQTADGPMTPDQVTGYASAFKADEIFFTASQLHNRSCNITASNQVVGAGDGTWPIFGAPVKVTRTPANNTTQNISFEAQFGAAQIINAVNPLKGIKPTAIRMVYEVTGADAGDDVSVLIYSQPTPVDGVATAAPTALAFTYDANHLTAAKRSNSAGGHQYNTMDCTITTPAWLLPDEHFFLKVTATEANNAANALALTIKSVIVYYNESIE